MSTLITKGVHHLHSMKDLGTQLHTIQDSVAHCLAIYRGSLWGNTDVATYITLKPSQS